MQSVGRLLLVALIAGALSGIFVTIVHQVATVPVILDAETYENAAAQRQADAATQPAAPAEASHEHEHGDEGWTPADGLERTLYTTVADVLTGIGFALVLVACYRLWGRPVSWRTGLYWGLAGFAAVIVAPCLGAAAGGAGHRGCTALAAPDLVGGDRAADGRRSCHDPARQEAGLVRARHRDDRRSARHRRAAASGVRQRGPGSHRAPLHRGGDHHQLVVLVGVGSNDGPDLQSNYWTCGLTLAVGIRRAASRGYRGQAARTAGSSIISRPLAAQLVPSVHRPR